MLSAAGWQSLLESLGQAVLRIPELAANLPEETRRTGWLGQPPASAGEIAAAERRLGVHFPPSYVQFLHVSNGWPCTGVLTGRLLSVQEIDWLPVLNREAVEIWTAPDPLLGPLPEIPDERYLTYDETQLPTDFRDEYLWSALQISEEVQTQVFLLNPRIATPAGEWEAWNFAAWYAGAARYRSFEELMLARHEQLLRDGL